MACCAVILAVVLSLVSMRYAAGKLESLRSKPGYVSAEQAMREMLLRDHWGGTVEIVAGGNDGPGLRYVVARVWPVKAAGGADGKPREVGSYFLRMDQGWVYLPEDELSGPVVAVGKALLDHLFRSARQRPKGGKGAS